MIAESRPKYGQTVLIRQDLTIASGAHAADEAVGGKLTFANAVRWNVWSGIVTDLLIIEPGSQQKAALDLVLFDRNFTAAADNAAGNYGASDAANIVGKISVAASDWVNLGANGAVASLNGIGLWFQLPTGTIDLYGQLRTSGTPNYTGPTPQLVVKIKIAQD